MLWIIAIFLIVLWGLARVISYPMRKFVHIFLVVGVIMVLVQMMLGHRIL
jgi:hypothetical protein